VAELLPPFKPIPIKERLSVLYIEKGHLDVLDGAFVILRRGIRNWVGVVGFGEGKALELELH
jgi:CRISPR-associated protein Cas1